MLSRPLSYGHFFCYEPSCVLTLWRSWKRPKKILPQTNRHRLLYSGLGLCFCWCKCLCWCWYGCWRWSTARWISPRTLCLNPWRPWQYFIKILLNGQSRFGLSVADIYNDLLELMAIIHRIVFHWLRISHVKCWYLIPKSVSDDLGQKLKNAQTGHTRLCYFSGLLCYFFCQWTRKYCFFGIFL